MSEYTPDTEEVRDKYIGQGFVDGEFKEYTEFARERIGAEFDRWLEGVKRDAWYEGQDSCSDQFPWESNPYASKLEAPGGEDA